MKVMEYSPLVKPDAVILSDDEPLTPRRAFLGAKTITVMGSIALTVNNISGPGMLDFPATFQAAGYVPCIITLVVVTLISSICAALLADAMARIPGNEEFQTRREFSDVFNYYLGSKWFSLTQVAFYFCLLTQNIAAIVSTSQVLDSMIATFLGGSTYAFELHSFSTISWRQDECESDEIKAGTCIPFSDNAFLKITLGYVLCTAGLFYPGLLNLEENIIYQIISFGALLVLTLYFLLMFQQQGLDLDRVDAFGEDWRNCIGVIIFNFAFCVTVPSWLNEKKPNVDVNTVIWSSTIGAAGLYLLVGLMGAMAVPQCPDNMLVLLGSPAFDKVTRFAAGLFGVLIIGLGIPIFCILMRYNLVVGNIMTNSWGTFFGCILPWLIGWISYSGHSLLDLLSWTGLILNGFIDFFSPALVALVAVSLLIPMAANQEPMPSTSFGTFSNSFANDDGEEVITHAHGGMATVSSFSTLKCLIVDMWYCDKEIQLTRVNPLLPCLRPYHARVVIVLIFAATFTVLVGLYMKVTATVQDITH